MIGRWWRERRIRQKLARRAIPDGLWHATLSAYPFLGRRPASDVEQLRTLTTLFLADKEFSGANGLVVTDPMAVTIAAQACLPVLKLGLSLYERTVGIVVHPNEVVARRHEIDEDTGVVHEYDAVLAGEAMEGGPVMLSWADVDAAGGSAASGYNVVIHEFVHLIDMADGCTDAVPPLSGTAKRHHWQLVMQAAFDRFRRTLDAGHETFLAPYAATAIEEFFPVAAEAFFVAPDALQGDQPQLYELFVGYFGQDPGRH